MEEFTYLIELTFDLLDFTSIALERADSNHSIYPTKYPADLALEAILIKSLTDKPYLEVNNFPVCLSIQISLEKGIQS